MPDIFDEVNEDLRAERAQALLRRYGAWLVLLAVLVVVGVGGWQFWRWRDNQSRGAVAQAFMGAVHDVTPPSNNAAAAMPVFADMAANGPAGYRTLARLREASLKVAAGELPAALALWDQVSADEGADRQLRSLADLLWVQHQVDTGEPAAVEGRLQPLLAADNPWRPLAREAQAWLKLRTGDTAGAESILRELVAMPNAPAGLRARAGALLGRSSESAGSAEKQG